MNNDLVVPNQPPVSQPGAARLAIVGEAPSVEECSWALCHLGHGFAREHWVGGHLEARTWCPTCASERFQGRPTPFVGPSGRLLDEVLEDSGLPRSQVFVGNVARVPLKEPEKSLENPEVKAGLARLAWDLEEFGPHCVLCLGGLSLAAFHPQASQSKITRWRGSIFAGTLSGHPYKCVAALHPAAILRQPTDLALFRFDVKRAVAEAEFADCGLPSRNVALNPSFEFLMRELQTCGALANDPWRIVPSTVGFDIEGGCDVGVTVCSLAFSPGNVLSIPFKRLGFAPVWSKDQEALIWHELKVILESAGLSKVMHNAAYEMFVLRWLHGIRIRNVEDTMLAWWSLYPELEKGLDVVASILTRQPHWGLPRQWQTDEERDTYNCIDSAVTLECWNSLAYQLQGPQKGPQKAFYEFSRSLLEPVVDMEVRGIRFDAQGRRALVARVQSETYDAQGALDTLAGIPPPTFQEVAATVAMKVKLPEIKSWPDVLRHAKPSYRKAL